MTSSLRTMIRIRCRSTRCRTWPVLTRISSGTYLRHPSWYRTMSRLPLSSETTTSKLSDSNRVLIGSTTSAYCPQSPNGIESNRQSSTITTQWTLWPNQVGTSFSKCKTIGWIGWFRYECCYDQKYSGSLDNDFWVRASFLGISVLRAPKVSNEFDLPIILCFYGLGLVIIL